MVHELLFRPNPLKFFKEAVQYEYPGKETYSQQGL